MVNQSSLVFQFDQNFMADNLVFQNLFVKNQMINLYLLGFIKIGLLQYHQYLCLKQEISLFYFIELSQVMPFIHNFLPHGLIYHYQQPEFSTLHLVLINQESYYYNNHMQLILLIFLQLFIFFIHFFILSVILKFLFPFINFISLYN